MTLEEESVMPTDAIHAFLGARQTAVMSLAGDHGPYAVPITYRFDPETERFFFRLIYPAGSEKRQFLPDVPECWLVAYEEDEPNYRSVIAKGVPTEIRSSDIKSEHVVQLGQTSRPLFEMWSPSRAELDIRLYELETTELTGRHISITE